MKIGYLFCLTCKTMKKVCEGVESEETNVYICYTYFELLLLQNAEAVAWRCSTKSVFLKFLQNSQENIRTRISFSIKFQSGGLQLY